MELALVRRSRMTGGRAIWLVPGLFLVAGCREPAPPPAPPPPEVRAIEVRPQPVPNLVEVPGRLQAVRKAEVRARVDGVVERRLYQEGTDVRAGQPLFAIDPSELEAQASAAEAALTRAEATAANARQDVERYERLVEEQAVSRQDYDAAVARLRTAQADVAQARAQVEAAHLNLGYATVRAPIAGRAGRAEVTEGALVSAAGATLLTTIEQIDPIYVNFSRSSSDLLSIRRDIASGALRVPRLTEVTVRLILEDGTEYPRPGHLNFLDQSIDPETGTTAFRAVFPNPGRTLLPGQFVRARIEAGVRTRGFMVPQRAVRVTADAATVMLVGENDVADSRAVEVGPLQGGSWVILRGLAEGDRVIVDGLQKVQPGQPVRPVMAAPDTAGAMPDTAGSVPRPAPDSAAQAPG